MRKALSIFLAALLIILPVEQVLAQAVQQEAVSVKQTEPADGAARLFRVQPLTDNSARLLRTSSDRALLNTPIADALFVQENNGEGGFAAWQVLVMVVAVVGLAVGIYYLVEGIKDVDICIPVPNADNCP